MTTELVGFAAALLSAMHMIPQLIKSIKTKHVKDVSFFMIVLYLLATGLWTTYGYMSGSMPVLIGDGFAFFITFAQLVVKMKYEKNA